MFYKVAHENSQNKAYAKNCFNRYFPNNETNLSLSGEGGEKLGDRFDIGPVDHGGQTSRCPGQPVVERTSGVCRHFLRHQVDYLDS